MEENKSLIKYLIAQNQVYLQALEELKNGKKVSHWMWFIFPQLRGLGVSDTAKYYAISNLEEAEAYFNHPVLGQHLIEISEALLAVPGKTATEIFGNPDDIKLRSSMTLFSRIKNTHPVFEQILEKYFHSSADEYTMELLQGSSSAN